MSDRPEDLFTTILGSCVATCICDPELGLGAMNHFLLPGEDSRNRSSLRYGVNAMETMVNALLKRGARRDRLQAKLFGGARMIQGLHNIGQSNADFARWYLETESIRCVGQSLGGTLARKIRYWPGTGIAQQQFVEAGPDLVQQLPFRASVKSEATNGGVTLF